MLSSVSVAMAAYNGEPFITEQIKSIISQLTESDELVISYDQSQDTTLETIKGFCARDSRVKLVFDPGKGVVSNFNNALAFCNNDAIFISDQDDIWVEGKRNRVLSVLNETGADLVIHNVVHINAEGDVISQPLFSEYNIGQGILKNFAKPRYSGCCMAFPKATLRIAYPMPEKVVAYDHWIGMSCELFGKVEFIEDVLLLHRLHEANATVHRRPLRIVASQRIRLASELLKRRKEARRS